MSEEEGANYNVDITNPNIMGREEVEEEEEEEEEDENVNIVDDNGGSTSRNNRHTPEQIQELENFFNECPRPDEGQKFELGQKLGMEPTQIQYWFQNKRTQVQAQIYREENHYLQQEHERLRILNDQLKEAMKDLRCIICAQPTNFAEMDLEACKLMLENIKLKKEIDFLLALAGTQYSSSLMVSSPERNASPEPNLGSCDVTMTMLEKSVYLDIANAATNELVKLGETDSPMWIKDAAVCMRETLNYEEYKSVFNNGVKPDGYVMEATRETCSVLMNSLALVKTLMDTNKWVNLFAPIVSAASCIKVLPNGPSETINGTLQLIEADFQVISPLVPKRQVKFLRYCQVIRDGVWIVVDVTPNPQSSVSMSNIGSNRLPSGLIIEDKDNGYSKVTWIEQAAYDESNIHKMYQLAVSSGIGLGAARWLTTLKRHCESRSILSSINLCQVYPGLSIRGATEMVKLAHRMTLSYYSGVTGSPLLRWEIVEEGQNIRMLTRKLVSVYSGKEAGMVLSASTSVRFPVTPGLVFDFLTNKSLRNQWDMLVYDSSIESEIIAEKSRHHGNYISVLKVLSNGMLILQEVCNDASGSMVVYAHVENRDMEGIMKRGENSDSVRILPSGFSILPDGETEQGCLVTLGFQVLVGTKPITELSEEVIMNVKGVMARTITKIKLALHIQT
ncbi:unnamed protein product [Cochlearia groenlandica]